MQIVAKKEEIEKALERANKYLDGNLEFLRFDPMNKKGTRFAVTLRVKSSKGRGHGRGHFHGDGRAPRRLVTPCWHAYGIFIDSLPKGAEYMSKWGGWGKANVSPWHDFQTGSMMYPCMASERCDCHEDGTMEKYLEGRAHEAQKSGDAYLIPTGERHHHYDGWRGHVIPALAIAGASDTGGWEDSPAPTKEVEKEIRRFRAEVLEPLGIPSAVEDGETSNAFCVKRWITVAAEDFVRAAAAAEKWLADHKTDTEYIHDADLHELRRGQEVNG